jgi:hypothetical protein
MQRVLIIAENSLQQERLCNTLQFDRSVELLSANLRQINPKNLKAFKQSDLIILEDTSAQGDPRTIEYILSSLKTTGLPIVLLPSIEDCYSSDKEPLVLNLTEKSIAQPGLAALINKIRVQYMNQVQRPESRASASRLDTAVRPLRESSNPSSLTSSAEMIMPTVKSDESSKILFSITAIGRITKQLREPLSNMNLAIHMLSKAQSIEERDRYVRLLREEYQRELQLLNELENLHSSILDRL